MKKERNPLLIIVYLIAAAVLIVFLGFLVIQNRGRKAEYRQTQKALGSAETELVREERVLESETETEAVVKAADAKKTDSSSSADAQTEEESESETEENSGLEILVLNGSGAPGMASVWVNKLEEEGYKDISSGSSSNTPIDQTIIYTQDRETAEPIKDLFDDARISTQEIDEYDIGLIDSSVDLDEIDVVIVLGKNYRMAE